jgi:signal transduction histidine kinase
LAVIVLAVQIAMPAFMFEHLTVLLVVALAMLGGRGPAIVVAVVASIGDNILLREPIGRPAIDGFRDVVDFGLFLVVAAMVGWLVNRLRAAKEQALMAAERERLAREQHDRLVATVTHDLATPLTVIQGTLQFLRSNASLTAVDLPRLLVRIETAAARATSLLRTLQDARSLEEDALSLNVRRADLRNIIEPTVRMLDRLSDRHPIALLMPDAPLLLDCDVERVGRVIENLLTNAIKYSPKGGPVEISALEEHGLAVLRVEDSGIGIPAFDHERLFELGYRTDTAATVASGLGLGLYIAAAIVRRHGGTLEAARREAGGSVFTVRLPLVGSRHASVVDPEPRGPLGPPYQYAS